MSLYNFSRWFFPESDPSEIRRKYGIPEKINFNISRKSNGWFVITSPDLPGLISQCKKLDDGLIETCNDAVLTYFDVPKRESDYVFDELNLHGVGQLKLKGSKQYA
ncbi:hypothetical protein L6307_00650 [Candidatus Parcubacteria bacterium]|nr:hypothetical protein [Candidatus Parcubacteria bacterium]